jgi:mannose-6-phosphate isomerase-like protein (cupin superfamily)
MDTTAGDPVQTDPEHYRVVFENDRVRVLEYRDDPGAATHVHHHPDSVMYTLSAFRRRVHAADRHVDVDLPAGAVRWVGAQDHRGENIGDTPTRALFVELKDSAPAEPSGELGPRPVH